MLENLFAFTKVNEQNGKMIRLLVLDMGDSLSDPAK